MEKIYGMMITGTSDARYKVAEIAINAFLEQTYPNKELVIVNVGERSLAREGVTEIFAKSEGITLGGYRNIALAYIPKGGVVVAWDDDDYKHPSLIEEQYAWMKKKKADLCLLNYQTYFHNDRNFLYVTGPNVFCMTRMYRNHQTNFYPESNCGEDAVFFCDYGKKYKVVRWDNPSHYFVRLIHDQNTCIINQCVDGYALDKTWLIDREHEAYFHDVKKRYQDVKGILAEKSK